jgi:hypothetical protein
MPHAYRKYYYVEYARGLVKWAYSLDQFESFTVRGYYSENPLALYWPEITVGLAFFSMVIVAIIFAFKKLSLRKMIARLMQNGFFAVFAVGFLDALALLFLSFLFAVVGESVFMHITNPFLTLLFIFIVMISLAITMLLPAYWLYKKHSVIHAVATVLLTLVFLFIIIYAYSVLFYKPPKIYEYAMQIK